MEIDFKVLREKLLVMLPELVRDPENVIVYNDIENPLLKSSSPFIVKFVNTACGGQFCLKNLYQGAEGSGHYLGLCQERTISVVFNFITRFHREILTDKRLARSSPSYKHNLVYDLLLLKSSDLITFQLKNKEPLLKEA